MPTHTSISDPVPMLIPSLMPVPVHRLISITVPMPMISTYPCTNRCPYAHPYHYALLWVGGVVWCGVLVDVG